MKETVKNLFKMNRSGKTLSIFLGLFVVVLVCGVSISLFLLQKETEKVKDVEAQLDESQVLVTKMQGDMKEMEKKVFVLEEKNKEADEKINSLLDDLELEAGLRDEIKKENSAIKEELDKEKKAKEGLREQLAKEVEIFEDKVAAIQKQLKIQIDRNSGLESDLTNMQVENKKLEMQVSQMEKYLEERDQSPQPPDPKPNQQSKTAAPSQKPAAPVVKTEDDVELDKIVVGPKKTEGRVLSVDKETEFLIFNLGSRDGVSEGDMMSIFRGQDYLGDVRVSRVQEDMAAADFVPPFSSRKVRKNDQVRELDLDHDT